MKRLYDQFTQTDFYRQREEAILLKLQKSPLYGQPLPGKNDAPVHDPSDVIYYTGCVAGSLGLPLDGDNVTAYLTLLKNHALDGEWPGIARLLSELYSRANEEAIAAIRADPVLAQQPWALLRTGHATPSAADFARITSLLPAGPERPPASMPLPPV